MRKPNLFIVGAPKCGTTALFTYLSRHPQVFMSHIKEPYFFATDFEQEAWKNKKPFSKNSDLESYLGLFEDATNHLYAGEGSVLYWISHTAAAKIAEFNPDSRIIVMLRDPVDFLQSWHSELVFQNMESEKELSCALALEETRRAGQQVPDTVPFAAMLFYSEYLKFKENLDRYYQQFPSDQIRIILFDDFKNDPARTFKETCDWLKIDFPQPMQFEKINSNKVQRFPFLNKIITNQRIASFIRNTFPEQVWRQPMRFYRRINTRKEARPAISYELKQNIQKRYSLEVERLGRILKRDLLTLWKYSPPSSIPEIEKN